MNAPSDQIVAEAFEAVSGIRRAWKFASSSIFYSNPYRTLRQGRLYLVGTNPGGSSAIASQTEKELRSLGSDRPWSAYLDQDDWQSSNLQRNLSRLAVELLNDGEQGLREVFATNAVFVRDDGHLPSVIEHVFEDCWPIHRRFLDLVRPEYVLAFGNGKHSAYSLLRSQLTNIKEHEPIEVYGTFSIRAVSGDLALPSGRHAIVLAGLPHLSRCNVAANGSAIRTAQQHGWLPAADRRVA